MSKTLLVLSHPNIKDSFANKIIVEKLKTLIPDLEIDNIYELYPDGKIDVKAEQEKLNKVNNIILAFPMYWFKSPYLLSKQVEDVFTHGFAYGKDAYKLEGKKLIVSMTMGGDKDEFTGKFEVERLVGPFECTALFVKMKFGGYAYTLDILSLLKILLILPKLKLLNQKNMLKNLLNCLKIKYEN